MSDGPLWFAPKRYGYGAGIPIAWQGWALLAGFIGFVAGAILLLGDRPAALIAAFVPVMLVLILIAARTTRGGWRWRWGKKD